MQYIVLYFFNKNTFYFVSVLFSVFSGCIIFLLYLHKFLKKRILMIMNRIIHQENRCIGCAYCVEIAPFLWEMNPSTGRCDLIGGTVQQNHKVLEIFEDDLPIVQKVIEICPAKCIKLMRWLNSTSSYLMRSFVNFVFLVDKLTHLLTYKPSANRCSSRADGLFYRVKGRFYRKK